MLSGSFFTISNLQQSPGIITGKVTFNADHPIFKGHFPSIPVVPGVCMIQLVKETLEQAIETKTRLTTAAQIKFLTMISPAETPEAQLQLNYRNDKNLYNVDAELNNPGKSYFKFKGELASATMQL